jgi:hypothetical protein
MTREWSPQFVHLDSSIFDSSRMTETTVVTGVLTSLRRLFARQAKGKRKLVLTGCYVNQHG